MNYKGGKRTWSFTRMVMASAFFLSSPAFAASFGISSDMVISLRCFCVSTHHYNK